MSYAILGAGKIGQPLAAAFARKGIEVAIASRQSVEALAPVCKSNRANGRSHGIAGRGQSRDHFFGSSFRKLSRGSEGRSKLAGQDRDRRNKRLRCFSGKAGQPSVLRCHIAGLTGSKPSEGV